MKIPIIASLNGVSEGGWVRYAKQMQEAGADALELNIYFMPTDPECPAQHSRAQLRRPGAAVKANVRIPVAVKIGPYFSSIAYMAQAGRQRRRMRW